MDDRVSGKTSTYVMIYGPRSQEELETVWLIVQISYYQARGMSMEPNSTVVPGTGWGWFKHIVGRASGRQLLAADRYTKSGPSGNSRWAVASA